jgi:hypothetical protein
MEPRDGYVANPGAGGAGRPSESIETKCLGAALRTAGGFGHSAQNGAEKVITKK